MGPIPPWGRPPRLRLSAAAARREARAEVLDNNINAATTTTTTTTTINDHDNNNRLVLHVRHAELQGGPCEDMVGYEYLFSYHFSLTPFVLLCYFCGLRILISEIGRNWVVRYNALTQAFNVDVERV